jgi:hypothetical protein
MLVAMGVLPAAPLAWYTVIFICAAFAWSLNSFNCNKTLGNIKNILTIYTFDYIETIDSF